MILLLVTQFYPAFSYFLLFYYLTKIYKENRPGFPVKRCRKHKCTVAWGKLAILLILLVNV